MALFPPITLLWFRIVLLFFFSRRLMALASNPFLRGYLFPLLVTWVFLSIFISPFIFWPCPFPVLLRPPSTSKYRFSLPSRVQGHRFFFFFLCPPPPHASLPCFVSLDLIPMFSPFLVLFCLTSSSRPPFFLQPFWFSQRFIFRKNAACTLPFG